MAVAEEVAMTTTETAGTYRQARNRKKRARKQKPNKGKAVQPA